MDSTTGKAIMIGVFSVVGWSLAFSQYTRNYGTIFCTSFAGAMLTIIGVDCFTRAGLKEFWIYIWRKSKTCILDSKDANFVQTSTAMNFHFTPTRIQSPAACAQSSLVR